MEGYQAGSKYSFSLTSTQATWSVDDDYLMAITGTNLDTDHGRITSIIADVGAINLFGINVDFNLFHAGMEEHDWTKIGAALKGIDLSFSSKGAYDHFQGLGGDDNITFINTSFYGDKVYFDGGNDKIILGNGSNSVYASSLNYVPDYETLHWEIDGRRGLNSLYLWQDPVTASSIGHQIVNATTKGFDITLGREPMFTQRHLLTRLPAMRQIMCCMGRPVSTISMAPAVPTRFLAAGARTTSMAAPAPTLFFSTPQRDRQLISPAAMLFMISAARITTESMCI